jgi:hypothetical protein
VLVEFPEGYGLRTNTIDCSIASQLKKTKVRFQTRMIERIVAWSSAAPEPSELAAMHTRP